MKLLRVASFLFLGALSLTYAQSTVITLKDLGLSGKVRQVLISQVGVLGYGNTTPKTLSERIQLDTRGNVSTYEKYDMGELSERTTYNLDTQYRLSQVSVFRAGIDPVTFGPTGKLTLFSREFFVYEENQVQFKKLDSDGSVLSQLTRKMQDGRIINEIVDNEIFTYSYNSNQRLVRIQGINYDLTYSYDTNGRRLGYVEKFSGNYEKVTYDSKGQTIEREEKSGNLLRKLEYDKNGLVSRITITRKGSYDPESVFIYEYKKFDHFGNWTEQHLFQLALNKSLVPQMITYREISYY